MADKIIEKLVRELRESASALIEFPSSAVARGAQRKTERVSYVR
jgi:hypothetical protein